MLGEDLLIAMGGRVIAAQRTCNLNMQQDTIEVCSPVSGAWREYIPSTIGWDISCDGLIYAPEYADELMEVLTSRQKVRLSYYDPELRIVRSGYAIPTGLQQGASINSLATYSLSFQGSGPLEKVEWKTLDYEYRIYFDQVQVELDKNHRVLYKADAPGLSIASFLKFDISKPTRLMFGVPYGGGKLGILYKCDNLEELVQEPNDVIRNLNLYKHEIACVGNVQGLESSKYVVLSPGRYFVLMSDYYAVSSFYPYGVSLPTE